MNSVVLTVRLYVFQARKAMAVETAANAPVAWKIV
jgi:hypothetical protein